MSCVGLVPTARLGKARALEGRGARPWGSPVPGLALPRELSRDRAWAGRRGRGEGPRRPRPLPSSGRGRWTSLSTPGPVPAGRRRPLSLGAGGLRVRLASRGVPTAHEDGAPSSRGGGGGRGGRGGAWVRWGPAGTGTHDRTRRSPGVSRGGARVRVEPRLGSLATAGSLGDPRRASPSLGLAFRQATTRSPGGRGSARSAQPEKYKCSPRRAAGTWEPPGWTGPGLFSSAKGGGRGPGGRAGWHSWCNTAIKRDFFCHPPWLTAPPPRPPPAIRGSPGWEVGVPGGTQGARDAKVPGPFGGRCTPVH